MTVKVKCFLGTFPGIHEKIADISSQHFRQLPYYEIDQMTRDIKEGACVRLIA